MANKLSNQNLTSSFYSNIIMESYSFLTNSRKANLSLTLIIIIFGLVGNFLILFILAQKRFRKNPSHNYLFSLVINDSIFLAIHFLEDTVRTYKDLYLNDIVTHNRILNAINLTDKYNIACKLVNFFRNSSRFVSVYIILAFVIQRVMFIRNPLSLYFSSTKKNWKIIFNLVLMAILLNLWVPLLFQIKSNEDGNKFCDMKNKFKKEYFILNLIYLILIFPIPILIIVVCNSIILVKTAHDQRSRNKSLMIYKENVEFSFNKKQTQNSHLMNSLLHESGNSAKKEEIQLDENVLKRLQPHFATLNLMMNSNRLESAKSSVQINKMLILLSFSFVLLNLPYSCVWLIYFNQVSSSKQPQDVSRQNYLFGLLQIAEVFYILNYSFKLVVYWASGYELRKQLKYASNKVF